MHMQTLTVQITNNNALKALYDLEDKRFIKIVKSPGFASPALPGKEMDLPAFEAWIADAEAAPSLSFKKKARQEKSLEKN